MLTWAQNKHITTDYQKLIKDMKSIGDFHEGFKIWESPFAYFWLENLSKKLNRKLKVMDFGCGISPFPNYLAHKGYDVVAIDDNSWNRPDEIKHSLIVNYPKVSYWWGNVFDYHKVEFDAIISMSVLEHVESNQRRVDIMKKLKGLLNTDGAMLHIIDFYYPEFEANPDRIVNFFELCNSMNFNFDPNLCPGSPNFDFSKAVQMELVSVNPKLPQSRIAIGDDI